MVDAMDSCSRLKGTFLCLTQALVVPFNLKHGPFLNGQSRPHNPTVRRPSALEHRKHPKHGLTCQYW